ncbi:MAG TPA: hypothetical protein VM533_03820 [Fimbriiglobus sp.]|nr:hypothetical protein [Fimbriiglobus sp.]
MNATLLLLLPLAAGNPPCKAEPIPPHFQTGMPYPPPDGPPGVPCPPIGPPAPVLSARVIAPEGVKVSVAPGTPDAKHYPVPTTFGFRPGYVYRLELTDLPGRPGEALYPVLEVRGSLVPRAGMNPADYPAPIFIDRDDIAKALAGGLVTKAIYLEDPTKAVPVQTRPDQPIEFTDLTEDAAIKAATVNGRLVAVLRFGDRKPDPDELAKAFIPGTVLPPGEQHLAAPTCPPVIQWCAIPLYDPIAGMRYPFEECFTDGGDTGPRLGVGPLGRLGGLNPTDVALEYTLNGKRRVKTSNQVCICVPRFVIRRVDVGLVGLRVVAGPDSILQTAGGVVAVNLIPLGAVADRIKPVGFVSRLRSALIVSVEGVHTFVGVSAPQAVATVAGVRVVSTAVAPEEITNINDLTVTKEVEPKGPVQIGDEVTFTIRYRNGTRSPVSELVLSDSLSGRLEYVPGSSQSDRPANVTTEPNEAGSVVVRFEIPGPVPPGQTGTVKFKARVR